jgi:hypothetical protein
MRGELLAGVLLLAIVFFSGCTMPWQQTTTAPSSGMGLTIESFGPEYNYVAGGDSMAMILKVRNNGDQDITGVRAEPYLLAWTNFNTVQNCNIGTLYKPNAEINRLGTPCTMKWSGVQVPKVSKQESFAAGVRVEYDYATEATATVYALTENKYKGYMELGQDVRSVKELNPGTGPIRVDVKVDDVLIYGSGNNNLPVTLVFTNTGGNTGKGYPKGSTDRDFKITSVSITSDSASGVSTMDTSDCNNVGLRGGQTGDCTIKLNVGGSYSSPELIVHLKIVAKYTYVEPMEISIPVNPSMSGS